MRALNQMQTAAVLGSGVMGAQIAAHLANSGLQVRLFDLCSESEGQPNALAEKALRGLAKLKPEALLDKMVLARIQAANYRDDLPQLRHCDLVIEAVSENPKIKKALYQQVAEQFNPEAIFASNTSGLSIERLAAALPISLRPHFCGIHFFNPPRYMHLVELIAHSGSDAEMLDFLEAFLTHRLGKGVIRARDTPAFIANRIGTFSIVSICHHAERFKLAPVEVDLLTGKLLGRPKSATYRTMDLVGLDILAAVVGSLRTRLTDDPWQQQFTLPSWIMDLLAKKALGQKSGAGVYKKVEGQIRVYQPDLGEYRVSAAKIAPDLGALFAIKDPQKRFEALLACDEPQAQFLRSLLADLFHYAAFHLEEIAHNAADLDLAMRWGFGWQQGPFELWQSLGWQLVSQWLQAEIEAGQTLSDAPLPDWVFQQSQIHGKLASWSACDGVFQPLAEHAVYQRQLFRPRPVGVLPSEKITVVEEGEGVRLWHSGDGLLVLGFESKLHTVDRAVLVGLLRAIALAEREFKALLIWQPHAPFCAGANLKLVLESVAAGQADQVETLVEQFQQVSLRLKYSTVPTVAAVQGLALGGGCELLLHCDRVVAAQESYIGLVETGVGLVPAGGGCKEMLWRALEGLPEGADPLLPVAGYFEQIAMAKVSASAQQARALGYLRPADPIVPHVDELLYVAKQQAKALAESNYLPPLPMKIPVLGRSGLATLKAKLFNLREGGFISPYDFTVAEGLARVLCGGDLEAGSRVNEGWVLALEREMFMALLRNKETQQRILHTLKTGKPLRN
ncbi:MAG: 3-hydroxyacyl-CoA dehydrogenase/enoyl-CoA hydratase family protein [Gammaproteobacteria bacterium]|nr:3-hydroxyacyl-CoA dehydrogenase/enoyl-CoA hydratase family protein [Gammaproteobacteria bacterium]